MASFDVEEGSLFPLYFALSYDCAFGTYWCQWERSPQFFIPIKGEASYNYNSTTSSAIANIPLWNLTCGNPGVCPLPDSSFCRLCDKGFVSSVTLDCTDCWLNANLVISDMQFVLGMGVVTLCMVRAAGAVTAAAQARLAVDGASVAFGGDVLLISEPIPSLGYEFDLGFMLLELGASWSITAQFNAQLNSTGVLTAGADATVKYNVSLSYFGEDDAAVASGAVVAQKVWRGVDAQMRGASDASVSLSPTISLTIPELLTLETAVSPTVHSWVNFSYPAFEAIPKGKCPTNSLVCAGGCSSPHAMEWDVTLDAGISASASVLSFFVWEDSVDDVIKPMDLVSGCAVAVTKEMTEGVFVYGAELLRLVFNMTTDLDLLSVMFASDLAFSLATDSDLFTVDATMKNDASVSMEVTFFYEDDGRSSYQMAKETIEVVTDESSTFYSQDTYLSPYLKGELESAVIDREVTVSLGIVMGVLVAVSLAVLVVVGVVLLYKYYRHSTTQQQYGIGEDSVLVSQTSDASAVNTTPDE
eukprot:TRINITY_DN3953_c0_g1_i1.p1 TRINITY_DN3953_c0_g1~~TRINITY_DN3953_c0_g1_i1.p1  ORF type:complete len:619 (-),score=211.23 TRINITY_DN3953_c0_g1_i1:82-1668(-)